jgi:hypothetical protein
MAYLVIGGAHPWRNHPIAVPAQADLAASARLPASNGAMPPCRGGDASAGLWGNLWVAEKRLSQVSCASSA